MDVKKKKNLNVSVKTALTAAGMREILKSWVSNCEHNLHANTKLYI